MEAKTEIENNRKIIKEKVEQLESKDKQIYGFNDQIKSSSKKILEMSDDLLRLYPLHSCPRAGPSGIYNITVRGVKTFEAPCNSTGWLTIQKRFDGSEDFHRPWEDYKNGFGKIKGEFFIGLEKLHVMTRDRKHELSIKLGKVDGSIGFVHYDHFEIGSEAEFYVLKSVGNHTGEPGDSLTVHVKSKFTTLDRDNDSSIHKNCASNDKGGWWYSNCALSKLNGKYYKEGHSMYTNGISWGTWHNYDYQQSLTFSEMMIRPKTVCA
ncbi:fibrinogen C domain-containing protein 1-like [Drosophila eugracilis]|uniref:fibrinogen C domain-containing protein 1-like n=1 Tax=Drosophila eugracilis TaxID=29029 RepID=UPI001BDB3BEC|nr:fibrinogen C domain-containing protein 1-like [Drosophila eugracilis]